jgi:hypothetical protein
MTFREIRSAALELDLKARAKLAQDLLTSLEELSDGENAKLWAEEARRRDEQLDQNPDLAVDGELVRKQALDRFPRQ